MKTRHTGIGVLALAVLSLVCVPARGQDSGTDAVTRLRPVLEREGIDVDSSSAPSHGNLQQLRVRLRTDAASRAASAAGQPPKAVAETVARVKSGPLRTARGRTLAPDRLVVVALDAEDRLKGLAIVQDPRIRRLEYPYGNGELVSDGIEYADESELAVTLPDDASIEKIRVYSTRWTGVEYQLDLVATIPLR